MHRLAATPGGWNPDSEGVIFIEQTPAPIVLLTAADTDIQTLAASFSYLPPEFPSLRVVNLLQLQQQLTIDTYADTVLSQAKVIILRLLGGRSYWSYGLEVVKEIIEDNGGSLWVLPGDDRLDPYLITHSNVSLTAVNQLYGYFSEGGMENYVNALKFVADISLGTSYHPPTPQIVPRLGVYPWASSAKNTYLAKVGLLFYRAHYLAGNILPIEAICQALHQKKLQPIPIFVSSLRDGDIQKELLSYFQDIDLLLNTTSFSIAKIDSEEGVELWQKLDVPVLQVIFSTSTVEQWQSSYQGLNPKDVAMNVALPEVDGRIITRAVSFKSIQQRHADLETDIVVYEPLQDRINFIVDLAFNYIKLRKTPTSQRKIALILANYPNRNGRIANGVGLDTPASCLEILSALEKAGYFLEDIPSTSDELMRRLTKGITNDSESELHPVHQALSLERYQEYFISLPESIQQQIRNRWGNNFASLPIPGIQLGNIFIGIQPSRGYDLDPSLNYHAPDLEPTHNYLGYYYWLKAEWKADAIIHVGKHGNLEWLPGKSLALSNQCYPEITLGSIPNFYPFIVNDPGEGSQAKRRAHAVIIDHLTPPMTRAELYGDLEKLETFIDEYYEAQNLDPSRLKLISAKIKKLINQSHLDQELGIKQINDSSLSEFLTRTDTYLCELKEAQIRDGLHIFGKCPNGRQLRDLIIAISRGQPVGIIEAIALDLDIDISQRKILEFVEKKAAQLVDKIINTRTINPLGKASEKQLEWIADKLLPALQKTNQEISNLVRGLDGKYIDSGAAGAPTRGRAEVLPTGRNFYSVDIRAIPTETAWDVGRKAAEAVIERYTQENGEYPKTLAISIWGTSTMRTGGDDIAQVLALLGVQPLWDGAARRVLGFEILSESALNRPRVDVTVRVSGFFRDSFANILELLYQAIEQVSRLKEGKEINPLAAQVEIEKEFWQQEGLTEEEASSRSLYRIFGSKPGAYGAGLQGLIEAQNWNSDEDLARAYINWSSYAYKVNAGEVQGVGEPEVFAKRLQELQIVLHNQDNREHDLLDSDDYYQFQGGLTAAIRSVTGKNPQTYFGDNSLPHHPKVRHLKEEIARVYRSRVINPKWIEGVMRHGYKGAFEMSATVDYLFAYDATARCVEDYMYQGVAEAYLFDDKVQKFIQQKNPWALRDMAERLLEANQRGLWENVGQNTIEELKRIANQAEGVIEGGGI